MGVNLIQGMARAIHVPYASSAFKPLSYQSSQLKAEATYIYRTHS